MNDREGRGPGVVAWEGGLGLEEIRTGDVTAERKIACARVRWHAGTWTLRQETRLWRARARGRRSKAADGDGDGDEAGLDESDGETWRARGTDSGSARAHAKNTAVKTEEGTDSGRFWGSVEAEDVGRRWRWVDVGKSRQGRGRGVSPSRTHAPPRNGTARDNKSRRRQPSGAACNRPRSNPQLYWEHQKKD